MELLGEKLKTLEGRIDVMRLTKKTFLNYSSLVI
jgi:hypothetical protein